MRAFILWFTFLFTWSHLSAQLSIGYNEYAQTDGDYADFDGYASDGCSTAFADSSIPSLVIFSDGCSPSSYEGNPYAEISINVNITNPPFNSFPTKSYLSYTIPFGFQTEFSISAAPSKYLAEYSYSLGYGTDFTTNSSSDDVFIGTTSSTEDFTSRSKLILPLGSSYYSLNFNLFGQNDPLETVSISIFGTPIKLLLPSQFFTDNSITAPTSVTISGRTFNVETVCADDLFLENVELDSYHYSAAGNITSNSLVVNGANVNMSAGGILTLAAGFTIDASSTFSTSTYSGCTP